MTTGVLQIPNVAQLVGGIAASVILYGLTQVIYNLWFHPLAKYPGPLLARATNIWLVKHTIDGTIAFDIYDLQKRYGDVVRIKPDELAYTTNDSWKQIYGYHSGKKENPKDDRFYYEDGIGPKIIFGANKERHGAMRRLLSHGFSEKSLRGQEPIVQKYLDLLIGRLHEAAADGCKKPVDMVQWLNFFTFDVIGDLAYGEPYHCLATGTYHPWVASIFGSIKFGSYGKLLNLYPLIGVLIKRLMMQRVSADRMAIVQLGIEKATKRRYSPNKAREYDLVYRMAEKDNGITDGEFAANTSVLLVAGSETTATLLCGVVYFMTQNPRVLQRLQEEVRSAFVSEAEITSTSVNMLKYLLACLDEGFRMYPPVPYGMLRRTVEAVSCWNMIHTHVQIDRETNHHLCGPCPARCELPGLLH